jgi:hypothetical protein
VGQLLDQHVGPERARPGAHHLLNRLVLAALQLPGPQQTKDDSLVVHNHAGIPSGGPDPLPDLADRLVEPAGRGVWPGDVAGTRQLGVAALGWQASCQPVELTGHVVSDSGDASDSSDSNSDSDSDASHRGDASDSTDR